MYPNLSKFSCTISWWYIPFIEHLLHARQSVSGFMFMFYLILISSPEAGDSMLIYTDETVIMKKKPNDDGNHWAITMLQVL